MSNRLLWACVLAAACGGDPGMDGGADTGLGDAGRGDAGVASPDSGEDAGPIGGALGAPCDDGADCASGICVPTGDGSRCSGPCSAAGDCPTGWSCDGRACACESASETCNGMDDDCDAVLDEAASGCAPGELCSAGVCTCTPERSCEPSACTDIENDPAHCGGCFRPCDAGQRCRLGSCCTPAPEMCNGGDDDCDGAIDEAAMCGGVGETCVDGACVCAATCGGRCVSLETDPTNCGACGIVCPSGMSCVAGACCAARGSRVDLLFMVDNSNSMTEEQASLAAEIPRMVRVLATGDVDGDGTPEAPPVAELNLGVVTSDMGSGGFTVPSCMRPDFGDDGILRTTGRIDRGCMATYPSFIAYRAGSDPATVARDFACVAEVGLGGCGFEQQLEAVLKAVTPSTSSLRFFRGTTGHADGPNAGFLRPDSIFATVLLSDENDCSARDPELFDLSSPRYSSTEPNLRCYAHADGALHPIARYADGLLALRSDPRDVIFAQITGVPLDLVTPGTAPDYPTILADSRMAEGPDPSMPSRLAASCNVPGRGTAFPPRRMMRVGQDLQARGAATVVGSICQESYAAAMGDVLRQVQRRLAATCAAP